MSVTPELRVRPDLSAYAHHRIDIDAAVEGTRVPGLTAEFFRRPDGDRIATVGRYTYRDQEILMAWGYVDEEHCRHSAVREPGGHWLAATPGCPTLRILTDGDAVTGLAIQAPGGAWIGTDQLSEPAIALSRA